jgi:hypothetical protein
MAERETGYFDNLGRPRFRRCVVLFMDLLGTAGPRGRSDALDRLRRTKHAITAARRAVRGRDADHGDWSMTWFSDNVSLHYAADGRLDEAAALRLLIRDVGLLQAHLFIRGLVARGAVAAGDFYSDDDFIHGPALDRAVVLEKRRAIFPRVVLDETAAAVVCHGRKADRRGRNGFWHTRLLRDAEGTVFVDYLGVILHRQADVRAQGVVFARHRDLVESNLRQFDGVDGIEDKYRWLATYHNWCVRRYPETVAATKRDLELHCARPIGEFQELSP